MKYTNILIAVALLFFASCHKNSFTIDGTISGGAGKTIYIEELTPTEPLFLDSIRLDADGHFSYTAEIQYATFYNVHVTPTNYVMLQPEAGDKIVLTGDYDNLEGTYEVRGSQGSMLLWQLQSYSNMGSERLKEIVDIDQENRQRYGEDTKEYKVAKQYTDSLYFDAYTEQSEYVKKFIEQNEGSLVTLIALYKPFGARHALIDIDRDPSLLSYYDSVLDGLKTSLPDNPHTIHFENSVAYLHHQYELYQQRQQAEVVVEQE